MSAQLRFDEASQTFHCEGDWSILHLESLKKTWSHFKIPQNQSMTCSGASLKNLDSAGALMLRDILNSLEQQDNKVALSDFTKNQKNIMELIASKESEIDYKIKAPKSDSFLVTVGKEAFEKLGQFDGIIILIGDLSTRLFQAFGNWKSFRFLSIVSIIQSAGVKALPILALLAFLIGVVLAYQMGLQLETYGANTFIAYLSGLAIFREFGPLITAIIVAGRTASAFTAQIGSMKINEEIDAIATMGLSPTELLVMPKVLGMLIVFPLLIFWADFFSVLGSMFMSKIKLGITPYDFLYNLRESVGAKQMLLGLYKAPVFAVIIALVGCYQGFQVELSADSLGSQTTRSVVQALFLIIIADAIFSVVYAWMDL